MALCTHLHWGSIVHVTAKHLLTTFAVECAHISHSHLCQGTCQTPCTMTCCMLLRDINFFPFLDPNWPYLPSANEHGDDCLQTQLVDDCLSCLFGERMGHGPGQCDMGCPRTVVTAVSGGHLNTSHFEFPLQDILPHMAIWRPQTVRVTNYCIISISTYIHSGFGCFVDVP